MAAHARRDVITRSLIASVAGIALATTLIVAVGCSSSKNDNGGGQQTADVAPLLMKAGALSTDERAQLQRAVIARSAGHVFALTSTLSTTQSIEVQYGENGRVEFTRTADAVHDTSVDPPRDGRAVAVHEYTGERLTSCDTGADRGEKVIRWDNLFDNDFVSLEAQPRNLDELRISIDNDATKDLGWDAAVNARAFETPNGSGTATIWIGGEGVPARTTTSLAPKGFYGGFQEKEPRETLGPVEGLTPPECFDPNKPPVGT